MSLLLKISTFVLVIGGIFILALTFTRTEKLDLMTAIKKNVSDTLEYPTAAQFRNIVPFFYQNTADGGKLYYACGEVYRFDGHIEPSGFKRFIVKTYEKKQERIDVSIPLIEGYEEIFNPEQFDQIWRKYCR